MRTIKVIGILGLFVGTFACQPEAKPSKTDDKKTAKADAKKTDGKTDGKTGDKTGDKPTADAAPTDSAAVLAGIKSYSSGDLDGSLAWLSDDVEWTIVGAPMPPAKGKAAVKEHWEKTRTAFPDHTVTPVRAIETKGAIAVTFVATGTHKGDFMGNAATDKTFGIEGLLLATVSDGKVTKVNIYNNGGAMMAQLGIAKDMPAPAAIAAPTAAPEILKGEPNDAALASIKEWYAAPMADCWKLCKEKYCAPDLVMTDIAEGKVTKTEKEHEAKFAELSKAFPDLKFTIDSAHSAGDWIIVQGSGTGTHKGDMGPIKATNKPITAHMVDVIKLEGGKVKEIWTYMNGMEIAAQLGLLPAAPPSEPAVATK